MYLNLLIVEDDIDVRDSIVSSIVDQNIRITTANNGIEALEVLSKNKDIDAVLTDINMPRMNGLEMIIAIRDSGSQIPVVFLSGYSDRDNTLKALRAGALDFLDKPFDIKTLNQVVRRALKIGEKIKQLDQIYSQAGATSTESYIKAHREIELMKLDNELLRSEAKKTR